MRSHYRKTTAVVGIATSFGPADVIFDALKGAGFANNPVSVLFSNQEGTRELVHEKNTKASEGTITGASTGGGVKEHFDQAALGASRYLYPISKSTAPPTAIIKPTGSFSPYQPSERPRYPPTIAPPMPKRMVIMKPPGSLPGMRNFATIPTNSPNNIQPIIKPPQGELPRRRKSPLGLPNLMFLIDPCHHPTLWWPSIASPWACACPRNRHGIPLMA